MTAFYNEIDPYAAAWLRNLIAAGHIAPGVVDERSIEDIEPAELAQYTQCHFFAGIGAWSHALRLAGWPDDRPVWTGSCPCQPFSSAGKGAGFDDERHLWPAFHWLISQCRPPIVFGEQVASKDGLGWLDLVQADLEGSGYATGAADLCAAGVGAPHIRQRLYWVADAGGERRQQDARGAPSDEAAYGGAGRVEQQPGGDHIAASYGADDRLDNNNNKGLEGHGWRHRAEIGHGQGSVRSVAEAGELSGLAHAESAGKHRGFGYAEPSGGAAVWAQQERVEHDRSIATGGLADANAGGERVVGNSDCGVDIRSARNTRAGSGGSSPTHGHWRDADWLHCRDGKWRPVEPGTFPLAHGATSRVGRLRAYGNAIVPQVAQAFVGAYLTHL